MSDTEKIPGSLETTYACNDCNNVFEEASEFHNHDCCNLTEETSQVKGGHGPYECEKCGKKYKQKRCLTQHLQVHIETLDFTCTICHKQFKNKLRLKCHYQTHTSRYVCPVCNKGFGENGNLKKHLRIHSGERPFVCDVCNRAFTQNRHLQDHRLTHRGEIEYPCEICGKKFLTKRTLKIHKYHHNAELPFGCKECDASFANYSSLKIHLNTHTEDKPFYCSVCGKGFKRHYDLRTHLTIHTGEEPYRCEICQKSFHKFAILKIHVQSHTNERNFVCHLCNKAFKTFSVLKKHCHLHTGERNKTCKICNKAFKSSNTLRTHYLTHTDERPFVCEVCGKTFKRMTPLQNHLITHTGELPYPCEVCGKRFARKITLENHFILHTGARPYVCPICNRGFTRKSSLKIHHTNVHTKDVEPEKLDCKAPHMLDGDLARHAILASHSFSPKPLAQSATSDEDITKSSTGNEKPVEGDVKELDLKNETNTLKETLKGISKLSSDDDKENSDCTDIDMEFSNSESTDLVVTSDSGSSKFSNNEAEFLHKGNIVKNKIDIPQRQDNRVRPYVCPTCNRGFTRKSSLKVHHTKFHTKNFELEILGIKAQHMPDEDLTHHDNLASHSFSPKLLAKSATSDEDITKSSSRSEKPVDGGVKELDVRNKTDTLKETLKEISKLSSDDDKENSDCTDIEMEFSNSENTDLLMTSLSGSPKFSNNVAEELLNKGNIVKSTIGLDIPQRENSKSNEISLKSETLDTNSDMKWDLGKTFSTVQDIVKIEPPFSETDS